MRPTPILLTPGPTPSRPRSRRPRRARCRTTARAEFKRLYGAVIEKLKAVYRTRRDVLDLQRLRHRRVRVRVRQPARRPGDRVLRRQRRQLRRALGARWPRPTAPRSCRCGSSSGARPDPDAGGRGDQRPTTTWSRRSSSTRETSTGATADLEAIAERTRERSALLVVDAISSLGAAPLETDALGPRRRRHRLAEGADDAARPGLRERLDAGLGAREPRRPPALLLRLAPRARRAAQGAQSPFTPAISLVWGSTSRST